MTRSDRVLVEASRYYYLEGLSQAQISHRMGISRSNISRILQQARERGIVEITINDPDRAIERDLELERQLCERFGLLDARVARISANRNSLDTVGRITAQYLSENLSRSKNIGLSWGKTLQHVVSNLPRIRLMTQPTVLPLVGGLSMMDTVESGDSLVQALAEKLGATTKHLYAPAMVGSEASHRALINEPSILYTLQQAAQVDLGIVGIGAFGVHASARIIAEMQLSSAEYQAVLAQHPVGDICGRFFDIEGNPIGPPSATRVISISFESLKNIPVLIGVAAGIEKTPGVLGALRSGALNVVAVDSLLATEILKNEKQQLPGE